MSIINASGSVPMKEIEKTTYPNEGKNGYSLIPLEMSTNVNSIAYSNRELNDTNKEI